MVCFNLRLLIHNRTRPDCSYSTSAREFWLTSVSLMFPALPGDLAEDGQLFILMGRLGSHHSDWGIKASEKPARALTNKPICQADLIGSCCFFPPPLFLFLSTQDPPVKLMQHKQNIWRRSTDSLARWIMARHRGRRKTFVLFHPLFSSLPIRALVGDGTSKASSY